MIKRLPRLGHYEPGGRQERLLDALDALIALLIDWVFATLAGLLLLAAVLRFAR